MKKLLLASVLATSSILAVTACTSVGATTDTSASASLQKQYKGTNKGNIRGPLSQLNLSAAQQSQIQSIKQNGRNERLQTREAIQKVLTVEQRVQLDSMKSERKNKDRRGGYKRGQQSPLAQLKLSSAQQTQIEAIRKNTSSDRMQKREAMVAVLTTDQRAQLEATKSQRQDKGRRGLSQ